MSSVKSKFKFKTWKKARSGARQPAASQTQTCNTLLEFSKLVESESESVFSFKFQSLVKSQSWPK